MWVDVQTYLIGDQNAIKVSATWIYAMTREVLKQTPSLGPCYPREISIPPLQILMPIDLYPIN